MALKVADRVKETTTTTGTGTITLAGAATGCQTFVAGVGDTNTTYYAIVDANGTAWEVGVGTVADNGGSSDTLARTTVLQSTNSDNAISLSSGTHTVFATYPGGKAVYKDATGKVGIGTESPSYTLDVREARAGYDSWVQSSGVRVGPSGTVLLDADLSRSITVKAPDVVSTSFTLPLPSGIGSNGQVLTTDSKNTYWSTAAGGVSGDTFATDLKIGRDAHNLIDFTTDDAVTFRVGNADEITLAANEFSPTTSDGIALGTGSKMWSDLFIADGGAVNFNNGDATLTHESNKIVSSGCELFVNRPGRSLATFR